MRSTILILAMGVALGWPRGVLAQKRPPDGLCTWSIMQERLGKSQAGVGIGQGPWTDGIVPYEFDSTITADTQQKARRAMDSWEDGTPLKFIPRTTEAAYILIVDSHNNQSGVGMYGGRQLLWLGQPALTGTIMHELGHAIGLQHEHQRTDRDRFIEIHPENLLNTNLRSAIESISPTLNYTEYDFRSIMHYGAYALSGNGEPTITARPQFSEYQNLLGQRAEPSELDKQGIALLYSHVPLQMAPRDNAVLVPVEGIELRWSTLPSAVEYEVQVAETADFSAPVFSRIVPADVITQRPIMRTRSMETGPLAAGTTYYWRVRTLTSEGPAVWSTTRKMTTVAPSTTTVRNTFPNPFRTSTEISFDLASDQHVRLTVYDALGRKVTTLVDTFQSTGTHEVIWANPPVSGRYFIVFAAEDRTQTRLLTVVK